VTVCFLSPGLIRPVNSHEEVPLPLHARRLLERRHALVLGQRPGTRGSYTTMAPSSCRADGLRRAVQRGGSGLLWSSNGVGTGDDDQVGPGDRLPVRGEIDSHGAQRLGTHLAVRSFPLFSVAMRLVDIETRDREKFLRKGDGERNPTYSNPTRLR